MSLAEYGLEPLPNRNEEFALYRGHARRPETPPALLLTPVSSRPARESLKKSEHEYSFRSELYQTVDRSHHAVEECLE